MQQQQAGELKLTGLYSRLSAEDKLKGESSESNSISNQKSILQTYADENGYCHVKHYVDDGYSGTTFDRPGFNELLADIENGVIGTIIVKDLSRLGRNYLQVGYYTEVMFPQCGVRFIAVSDGVDSQKGYDDFAPIKNIINDWYAKDISRKQRIVTKNNGNAGKRLTTHCIYGYKKAKGKQWVVDEEAAAVVKKIFELSLSGYGIQMIANYLFANKVKIPSVYFAEMSVKEAEENEDEESLEKAKDKLSAITADGKNPYRWSAGTVAGILSRQEYCGDTVNFKYTRTDPFARAHSKMVRNDPCNIKVFEDTQAAIISREDFHKVQEIRSQRKRITPIAEKVIFGDVLFCGDCKSKMYIMRSRNWKKQKPDCYVCGLSRKNSSKCSSHYISERKLIAYVTEVINKVIEFSLTSGGQDTLYERIERDVLKKNSLAKKDAQKNLRFAQERIQEIDKIIKSLYEDKVSGVLPKETFLQLLHDYKDEQEKLKNTVVNWSESNADADRQKAEIKKFLDVLSEYKEPVTDLNADVVSDFIERIEVFEAKKIGGKRHQQIDIYFKGIGLFDEGLLG